MPAVKVTQRGLVKLDVADADVERFDMSGSLTVWSITGQLLARYRPGEWDHATAYGTDGHPLYWHVANNSRWPA